MKYDVDFIDEGLLERRDDTKSRKEFVFENNKNTDIFDSYFGKVQSPRIPRTLLIASGFSCFNLSYNCQSY